MERVCVLYPCYFHAGLRRAQGRRVPKALAVRDPSLADLKDALKKCGCSFRTEEKHHPAHWHKREGRVVVDYEGPKSALILKVARALEVKR
ncbi:signal recognition particle protein Srp19 [Methanofollis formosanus]|uniref:Signal recognition particle 19 kDa protein n=1 Tax=Methanofollis formosanus TaxID=299308 RepID=A0A8G1EFR3_9EURY|nr:signal recognition particle subunit SRP19/SEC65 family protein [Methanofollis formosanus]QYZ79005.1 signal recognition particle protein Srp19 [Methanofollis formosanus]